MARPRGRPPSPALPLALTLCLLASPSAAQDRDVLTSPGVLARLRPLTLPRGQAVRGLVFAPDGKSLFASGSMTLTSGSGGAVVQWDLATEKVVRGFETPATSPLTLSADGKRLASSSGLPVVWDAPTGVVLTRLGRGSNTTAVALSPDGKALAAVDDDHHLRLWDVATGTLRHVAKGHDAYGASVAFSPDGKFVATGSHDRTVRLWDAATGKEVRVLLGHTDQVSALAFTPDGKRLLSGSWDRTLRLWDVETGKAERSFRGHDLAVTAVAVAPGGRLLASSSLDGTLRLWDPVTGREQRQTPVHAEGAFAVAFTPDGKQVAAGGPAGDVTFFDTATGKPGRKLAPERVDEPRPHDFWSVAFAPDGKTLVTGSSDHTVRLWDAATGKELRRLGRQPDAVWSVACSPDGKVVASAGRRDGTVHIWDLKTGKEVRSLTGQKGGISRIVYSSDGRLLVAAGGSFDPTIYVWNARAGKVVCRLTGHTEYIEGVAISPDNRTVASVSRGETARLWDLETGRERRRLPAVGPLRCVAFSPDGRTLAAGGGGEGESVILFDAATGRVKGRLRSETPGISSLAFARDGRTLAGAGLTRDVHVWEVATGQERRQFTGPQEMPVACIALAPDGRTLAAAGKQGEVLLWDVTGLGRGAPIPVPGEDECERLWEQLAAADAGKAHDAVWKLTAAPGQALPLLGKHLRPAEGVPDGPVDRLLADLDSERFAVRERAMRELKKVGDGAEGALRRALAASPSLEARRRIEVLLDRLSSASPERARLLRALEVLENVGTPEARRLLERLAGGAPDAMLTREARGGLARLKN